LANVTVELVGKGFSRTTDAAGQYGFGSINMTTDSVTVSATLAGYAAGSKVIDLRTLSTGAVVTADIQLSAVQGVSGAKSINAYSFADPTVTGTINEAAKTISVSVPAGTVVTALVASFSTSGAAVQVNGVT
jgi:hypothetical protein